MSEPIPSLIEYPCEFPIKVMGPASDNFAPTIADLVKQHDPTFDSKKIEMRASAQGRYQALTVTVHATSREQLDTLYRALSAHPMVKIVL